MRSTSPKRSCSKLKLVPSPQQKDFLSIYSERAMNLEALQKHESSIEYSFILRCMTLAQACLYLFVASTPVNIGEPYSSLERKEFKVLCQKFENNIKSLQIKVHYFTCLGVTEV